MLGYLRLNNYRAVIFFLAVGLLSSYFSKNMIINLGIALLLTNLIFAKKAIEGMENEGDSSESAEEPQEEQQEEEPQEEQQEEEPQEEEADIEQQEEEIQEEPEQENVYTALQEGLTSTKGKKTVGKKQGFKVRGMNVPKSQPARIDGEEDEEIGQRIDYASTLEQAYDNLQNMLGKGGISNLTKETQTLISQQKNLMGTLGEIQPLIKSAKETLSNLNMGDLNKGLSNITGMLGSLGKK